MSILVTGSDGQLGRELVNQLGADCFGLNRERLDLGAPARVEQTIVELRPTIVINTAAYTAVDRAEEEESACLTVNVDAVAAMARACTRINARLVQISTDYVFGESRFPRRPLTEEDVPRPQGVYATSKLRGEQAAATVPNHLIVRTCGLYLSRTSPPPISNFPLTMLQLGQSKSELRVVNDQHCSPSYVPHIAAAIRFLATRGECGVFHVVNEGDITWFEFAQAIFAAADLNVRVTPVTTEEFGVRASRPRYSVLQTQKYQRLGGPPLPCWREGLKQFMGEWQSARNNS